MWQWIIQFLSTPILNSLVTAYKAKLDASNTTEAHAVDLAKADLQAQIDARKEAVSIGTTPLGTIVQTAFAFPVIIYVNKVIIWDKIWPGGSTDPITGDVGIWVGLIIGFYFGGMIIDKAISRFTK